MGASQSFLLKSTYDMLPTPANLVRWKISEDDKCECGKVGTLRHILSACPIGLIERYTWRHNQVLQVFFKYMKEKILEINENLCPLFFTKFLFFHQMIALQKLRKMFFISPKKLFSFSRYSNFCSFFPYFPHFPDSKGQMKVE